MKPPKWTEAEDAIIREHYPLRGARVVASMLLERQVQGVKSRASMLGVKKIPARDMLNKPCSKCQQVKQSDQFAVSIRWGKSYPSSHCRACEAAYMRGRPAEVKKAIEQRSRDKNRDKLKKSRPRKRTAEQLERIRISSSQRYYTKREEILAKQRQERKDNPEAFRTKRREAYRRDRSSSVNADHKRKARLRGSDATMTRAQWKAVLAWFENTCAYCQLWFERLTQDHVIPISRGGAHAVANIVPACRSCNARKYARTPEQAGMPIHWPAKPLVLETV